MAKRILKDPGLSQMATRKFHGTIDKQDENKFVAKGAVITELLVQ